MANKPRKFPLRRFEIRIDDWMDEGVKQVAEEKDISANEYARNIIETDLAKHGIKMPKKTIKTEQE